MTQIDRQLVIFALVKSDCSSASAAEGCSVKSVRLELENGGTAVILDMVGDIVRFERVDRVTQVSNGTVQLLVYQEEERPVVRSIHQTFGVVIIHSGV